MYNIYMGVAYSILSTALLARRSIMNHGRRYATIQTVTKQNSLLEDIVIRFSKAYKSLSGGMGVAATPNRTFVAPNNCL